MRVRNRDQCTTVFVSRLKIGAIEFHWFLIGGTLAVGCEVSCHLDSGCGPRRASGGSSSTRLGRGLRISLAVYLEDDIQKLLLNLAQILFLAFCVPSGFRRLAGNISFQRFFELLKFGQRRARGSVALAGQRRRRPILSIASCAPNDQHSDYR